jgi:hypothetical protein
MKNKKALELEMLVKLIITAVIIGVLIFVAILLKTKNINAIEYVKQLFRLG